MSKLKISDSEFIFSEKVMIVYLDKLTEIASSYVSIVSSIFDNAICDQDITKKLSQLCQDVNTIIESLEEIRSSIDGQAKDFIDKIDEIDRFIY